MLLVPQPDGSFKAARLDAGAADRKKLGRPGACLVADFDGDGIADILEPFAASSLFYKGQGNGTFAPAVKCDVAQGKGRAIAWLGDFDCDGRMDIFISGENECRLGHNCGGMKFQESLAVSGEVAYMAQPGAVCGQTCDVNNDGRPDVMMCYREGIPWIFFNRGFRSFAKALELTEDNVTSRDPQRDAGGGHRGLQRRRRAGPGLVLTTGEIRMFLRSADDAEKCLAARVRCRRARGRSVPCPSPAGPKTAAGGFGTLRPAPRGRSSAAVRRGRSF